MEEIEGSMYAHVPNDQYDSNHTLIARFESVSDVNNFCNNYNHTNGYNGLKLGQRINIKAQGINHMSYSANYSSWYIAGFDCEYSRQASNGSTYDNGYGICLVASDAIRFNNTIYHAWDDENFSPYISSNMHQSILNSIGNSLKSTLGDHLINRKVLLSSNTNNYGSTISYTWTTAYCTLLSLHQLIGFPPLKMCSKYDTGEANYILPLYNYMNFGHGLYMVSDRSRRYWTRSRSAITTNVAYVITYYEEDTFDQFDTTPGSFEEFMCPMIYIR